MNVVTGFLSAFGLSTASGLNAYIPLLVIGLLGRFAPQLVHLNAPYDILTNPWLLVALALVALLDFVADKIPAVDSGLHAIGLVISPLAGAVAFLASTSAAGGVNPVLAAICGLLFAGGTHIARTTLRPLATVTTAGVANPILSFIEDISALVLSLLAILLPILAFLLVLLVALAVFWFVRRVNRGRRAATIRR